MRGSCYYEPQRYRLYTCFLVYLWNELKAALAYIEWARLRQWRHTDKIVNIPEEVPALHGGQNLYNLLDIERQDSNSRQVW